MQFPLVLEVTLRIYGSKIIAIIPFYELTVGILLIIGTLIYRNIILPKTFLCQIILKLPQKPAIEIGRKGMV